MNELSANTQAILLLTAPLMSGRTRRDTDLLTTGEYRRLAERLHSAHAEPADLLGKDSEGLIDVCRDQVEPDRLKRLLGRGFLLAQAVERWGLRAIWVLSRADPAYPRKLRRRLGKDAPALLYGCGERSFMDSPALAIVGSRDVDDTLVEYTKDVASQVSNSGRVVVSGGARGVDQAAMNGAVEVGGKTVGVMAGGLERATLKRAHRDLILTEQLLLVSPYDPCAGFSVGNAMQRNKTIYGLADAALVVDATLESGGTWAGAIEQLRKYSTPVYVRSTGAASEGLTALRDRGAARWPDPDVAEGIETVFAEKPRGPVQPDLFGG